MLLPRLPQTLILVVECVALLFTLVLSSALFGLIAIPLFSRHDKRLREKAALYLEANGWDAVTDIPEEAIKARSKSDFRLAIPWTDYVCTHRLTRQNVSLYFAVAKWGSGGRGSPGEFKNRAIVASAEIHAPVDCLVAMNNGPLEGFHENLCILRLHATIAGRPDLFAHFKSHVSIGDPEIDHTIKIVRSLFIGAEEVFESSSVALIARSGFIIRGPVLSENKSGALSIDSLVRGSQRLLANCENAIELARSRHNV